MDHDEKLWTHLLVTALKRGSLYVAALSADGQSVRGSRGLAEAMAGVTTRTMTNKGSILAFTYVGEGPGAD